MIILSIIVQRDGFIEYIKSFYCNVASASDVPGSGFERVQKEYCKTIRKFTGVSGEAWGDEEILDYYGWAYCEGAYDIELVYSDETEQIYAHL